LGSFYPHHQKIRHSPGNFRLVLGDNLWIPSGTGILGERSMKAGIGLIATRHVVVLALLLGWPLQAGAQPSPLILSPTPGTMDATVPFCYYAGLSYSVGAVIAIKVPVRREIVSDTPWQELRCETNPTSTGLTSWVEVDPDEDDPFRD
jgi:hypothetical protein